MYTSFSEASSGKKTDADPLCESAFFGHLLLQLADWVLEITAQLLIHDFMTGHS